MLLSDRGPGRVALVAQCAIAAQGPTHIAASLQRHGGCGLGDSVASGNSAKRCMPQPAACELGPGILTGSDKLPMAALPPVTHPQD